MSRLLQRIRVRCVDRLKYSRALEVCVASGARARAVFTRNAGQRLDLLLRSHRYIPSKRIRQQIETPLWRTARIGWDRYPRSFDRTHLNRCLILKAPGANGEKGVLLVMFEYNWLRLFAHVPDLRALEEQYFLILSTSWSPTDYALLALALTSWRGPLFVQACNYDEIPALEQFHPRIHCLRSIACDWIHPDFYRPRPFAERPTDILMVSNWAPFKRHWQLFDALRKMPKDLRVTLIGQEEGRYTQQTVHDLAALFGVKQEIKYEEQLPIEVVTRHQCESKVSLILSRREGCCVAAVESLFAGAPLGMMRGAHVGPTAYINEQTGRLLDPYRLDRALMQMLERAQTYRPREWATANISCFQSHQKLNTLLKDYSLANRLPWTSDIKQPCWRPYPTYVDMADREELRPCYEELHNRYPQVFGLDLIPKDHALSPARIC